MVAYFNPTATTGVVPCRVRPQYLQLGLLPEEQLIHRIAALIPITIAEGIEEAGEFSHLIGRHLQAHQDAAPAPDSADALACAICHAHVGPLQEKLGKLGSAAQLSGNGRFRNGRLVG